MGINNIVKVPFLPYKIKSISTIIHKKLGDITTVNKKLTFNPYLVNLAINMLYLK